MLNDTITHIAIATVISLQLAGNAAAENTSPTTPQAAHESTSITALLDDGWGEATLAGVARDNDKMTVRVRFTKAEEASGSRIIYGTLSSNIWESEIYVVSGEKKYLLLTDSKGKPLASSNLQLDDRGPQAGAWHGTFPAPQAGASATLQLPGMEPLGPFTVPE